MRKILRIGPEWWVIHGSTCTLVYPNAECAAGTYCASFYGGRYTCIHGFADPLAAARQFAASDIMLEAWEKYTADRGGCAFLRLAQQMALAVSIADGTWEPPEEEPDEEPRPKYCDGEEVTDGRSVDT